MLFSSLTLRRRKDSPQWSRLLASQHIEYEAVPGDATVVEHTWQYVNKKGGPDRRFKNNRKLPVCRVNRLHLSSDRGLDVRLMASRDGAFNEFARAFQHLATIR